MYKKILALEYDSLSFPVFLLTAREVFFKWHVNPIMSQPHEACWNSSTTPLISAHSH